MSAQKTYDITLRLNDIHHLFEKPDLSPFSDEYMMYSYTAGIEFIANELYANPSYRAVKATIVLPGDKVEPGLANRTQDAVKRYCQSRLKDIEHDIYATRWRGARALLFGFVALFAFIGASRLVYNENSLIPQIISEGLAVAGWVALWFPLEQLTFTVWQHRLDKRVYSLLMDMELAIQSTD